MALEALLADETAGDPMSGLKWTHKSLRKLQQALGSAYPVSLPTISRLLQERDYSLRVNHKRVAGKQSPHRDEQFRYIVRWRQAYVRRQWRVMHPVRPERGIRRIVQGSGGGILSLVRRTTK